MNKRMNKTKGFKAVRLNIELFPVTDHERELLRDAGIEQLVEINGDSEEQIIEASRDADVMIINAAKVRKNVINQLEKCKLLCRYGIGTDNIDVDVATERGILVTNVPDFCLTEMADHTMALILGVARNLVVMHNSMLTGNWIQAKREEKLLRISGKTLGLIGFGNTAKEVARRAQPFGLRIIDYHRNVNPAEEQEYGVEPVSLDKLLRESDFVVLLCALTPATQGMIGEKELRLMKSDAILINTSRGALVDEAALGKALKERWILGAGIDCFYHLDVFNKPKFPIESPYFGLDNIIMTPHIGGSSEATSEEVYTKGIAEIKRLLSGKWPINVVNRAVKPWFEFDNK